MKAITITLFIFMQCFLSVCAQITFDKGYIIDNSGVKIDCLIKNHDWKENPKSIQYKLSSEDPVITSSIDSIREFKVDNYPRFVRATVKIDRSPVETGKLSTTSAPLWSEETLFLRELTCGKACLWVYFDNQWWFFYSIDGSQPKQLVYKKYTLESKNYSVYENAGFRKELSMYLLNENTKNVNFNHLQYREKALVNYFKRYNAETDESSKNIIMDAKRPERELLNLKITGSLNNSRIKFSYNSIDLPREYDFGGKINWMGGLELEYFLPFSRNTWSILCTPMFEHYKNSMIIPKYEYTLPSSIEMTSVHFPVGVRYSLYLNTEMKFLFDFCYNSFLFYNKSDGFWVTPRHRIDITEGASFISGAGFAYKNWQIELKYHTNRNLLNYSAWGTDYTKVELSVAYKLLSFKK